MRILDLFCGGGGAAEGYHRAFPDAEIVGIDNRPQPRYPFRFMQADAMACLANVVWLRSFDLIHASPPCERYSRITGINGDRAQHPDLLAPTRALLFAAGVPFVIENVADAPMIDSFVLCGSSFGLNVQRHRRFETGGWSPVLVPPCAHHWQRKRFRSLNKRGRLDGKLSPVVGVYGSTNYSGEFPLRCAAMGIDWMTNAELVKAIPPAYTEFIGHQFADMFVVGGSTPAGGPGVPVRFPTPHHPY